MTEINETTVRAVVTFGQNHTHPVSGRRMGGSYVVVEAADYEAARAKTIAMFGTRWSFDYVDGFQGRSAEDQAGVDEYHLTLVDFETGDVIPLEEP